MEAALTNVFLKTLNMSITAAYVLLFVCILRLFIKEMPKAISYSLWFVVLFRLVCPVSFSSVYSLLNAYKRLDIPASQSGFSFVTENIKSLTPIQNDLPEEASHLSKSPLAFGERGTKSRIRNILNDRKPVFWIDFIVVALVVIAGVCLLANLIFDRQPLEQSIYDSSRQNTDIQITINDAHITPDTQNIQMMTEFAVASESSSQTTSGETSSNAQINQTAGPTTSQDGEPDFPFTLMNMWFATLTLTVSMNCSICFLVSLLDS